MKPHQTVAPQSLIALFAIVAALVALGGAFTPQAAAVDVPKTIIVEDITTSTTWKAADSPFLVTVPITVLQGATLTIEPGVEVQFLKGAGMTIAGGLRAQGSHARQIWLHASGDDWLGLRVSQPAGEILIQSATIEQAQAALTLAPPIGPVGAPTPKRIDLLDSLLRANVVGLSLSYAGVADPPHLTLRNNLISGNPIGLLLDGLPAGVNKLKLSHNSFVGNGLAIKLLNAGGGSLHAPWQWWADARGPLLLAGDDMVCTNSAPPAPGSSLQEQICGNVAARPFSTVPAGRALVAASAPITITGGIGAGALSDNPLAATSIVTVTVPAGAFAQPIDLLAAPRDFTEPMPGQPSLLGFELAAAAGGQALREFANGRHITVTIDYVLPDIGPADPNHLLLYGYNESLGIWHFAGIESRPAPINQRFVGLLGRPARLRVTSGTLYDRHLPIVAR